MESNKGRWQLTLGDVVLTVLLVGGLSAFYLPLIVGGPTDPGPPYPTIAGFGAQPVAYAVFSGVLLLIVLPTLLSGNRYGFSAARRWGSALVLVLVPCAVVLFLTPRGHGERRYSLNESRAARVLEAYRDAQKQYKAKDHDGDGVLEYAAPGPLVAAKLSVSTMDLKELPPEFANAFVGEGKTPVPYNGYIFKELKGQSAAAKGGALSFVEKDASGKERMTKGHGVVAVPAVLNLTGRHIFIVSAEEGPLQRAFEEKTPEEFRKMTEFNPEANMWAVAE